MIFIALLTADVNDLLSVPWWLYVIAAAVITLELS